MKNIKGACMFAQSGGPTSVINSSAAGVFLEALKSPEITKVYGAAHGIKGVLDEQFYDIGLEDKKELELLKYTPSSALGSVRYKLKDVSVDDTDYKRILEVFKNTTFAISSTTAATTAWTPATKSASSSTAPAGIAT